MELGSKTSVRVFALALVCLVAVCIPLLAGPGPVNTRGGGDSSFLFVRLEQLVAGLRAGSFPARWMPDAAYGLGYPFFDFYAALPYYLAAGLRLLGWGPIHALQAVQVLGFVLAAAAMALLARRVLNRAAAVALAVAAYTCAPFHLANVYVRGDSLSEFYAFVFYPLILWALHRLRRQPTLANMAWLGLSYGGLILTHNLSAVIFTPFAGLYALALLVIGRRPVPDSTDRQPPVNRRPVLLMGGGILLGLTLSATLWLVATADLSRVWMGFKDIQTEGFFNYAGQFRGTDLIQDSLLFDYQISAGHTPFAMGLVQAVLILAGAGTAVVAWWSNRRSSLIWIWLGGLFLSTLLITPLSRPLWDYLPVLPVVQFPWRFLSVQALFGALLTAELAERLPHPWWIAAGTAILLLAAAVIGLQPEYLPVRDADLSSERLALFELFTTNIGTTIRGEYLPAAVEPRLYASAVTLSRDQRPPPTAVTGTVQAIPVTRDANSEHWRVSVTSPEALLGFHTLYFAGWRATLDGRPVEIAPLSGSGLISLRVPEGTHEVILKFGRTPARWAADLISLAAGVGILILLWPRRVGWTGPRLRLAGLILAAGLIGIAALTLAENAYMARADEPRTDDLSMDFDRMPFLHHNPAGVSFGSARLDTYTYADRVQAGDILTAALHWSASAPDTEARLELVSPANAHPDLQPAPQPLAQEQVPIADFTTHALAVPEDTAAGLYYLVLRVWAGGSELRAVNERGEPLGILYLRPVWVENSRPTTGQEPILARFEDLWLGEDVRVTADESGWEIQISWLPIHPLTANYSYSLRLLSASGAELAGRDIEGGGGYGFWPTSTWPVGHWLADRLRVSAPPGVQTEDAAALRVVLYDRSQPGWPAAAAVTVPLVERAHSYRVPEMGQTVDAVYGGQMELLGYDVTQPDGQTLQMKLYWRAVGHMATDWTVFVHLLDAEGQIMSQWDNQPVGGAYPTSWWREGEIVVDEITLALDQVPSGSYRLAVGLYDSQTAVRLPMSASGAEASDGRLLLEALSISR